MKKGILGLFIVMFMASFAFAGTIDTGAAWTKQKIRSETPARNPLPSGVYIYEVMYRSDAAGAFTSTTLDHEINGYILGVETVPSQAGGFTDTTLKAICATAGWSGASPTANYDVYLKNSSDRDLLGASGENRSATSTEYVMATLNSGWVVIPTFGPIDLEVLNMGATKVAVIRIYYFQPYRTPY